MFTADKENWTRNCECANIVVKENLSSRYTQANKTCQGKVAGKLFIVHTKQVKLPRNLSRKITWSCALTGVMGSFTNFTAISRSINIKPPLVFLYGINTMETQKMFSTVFLNYILRLLQGLLNGTLNLAPKRRVRFWDRYSYNHTVVQLHLHITV